LIIGFLYLRGEAKMQWKWTADVVRISFVVCGRWARLCIGIYRGWQVFKLYIARRLSRTSVLLCAALLVSSQPALAQFTQQGSKLVGSTSPSNAHQGAAVALSADGNTAIVGGWGDGSGVGAAWVFTRSGGTWTQQTKLVGTGAVGNAEQGVSVRLSADGNTAIVGGYYDNTGVGAAWVFTRSGSTWTQQAKLVGSSAVGAASQGFSIALSGDGNTAAVGGWADSSNAGATWIFTRSGSVWSQQGSKLVGSGAVGSAGQGHSVALSADGNTLVEGGSGDNGVGAVWVFTRNAGVWNQQGNKLVGTGAIGGAGQGWPVALSADGNTAIAGGAADNSGTGAAWVFTRSGSTWTQQGSKLVATGHIGNAIQDQWVGLSGDGNLAIIGSSGDGAWVFTRIGGVWSQLGSNLVGTGAEGNAEQGVSVGLSTDGSTAIVGGDLDHTYVGTNGGAAWVFIYQPVTPGVLTVAAPNIPMDLIGPVGGPFWPFVPSAGVSLTPGWYTLSNTGGGTINFSVSPPAWLNANPQSGSLAAGVSTIVSVTTSPDTINYAAGNYTSSLIFTNTTNGMGNTSYSANFFVRPADSGPIFQSSNMLVPSLPSLPDAPPR
jgi:hypothetical protein